MDPSDAELASFSTLADIYTWAGVNDIHRDALYAELGELNLIRELACIESDDFKDAIVNMKIPVPNSTTGEITTVKAVNKTRLNLARNAARLRCNLPPDGAQVAGPAPSATVGPPPLVAPAAAVGSGTNTGIELGSVWDQASKTPVVLLGVAETTRLYDKYRKLRGSLPHPDSECTEVQLSATKQVNEMGLPPAADFAVFGPHGNRLLRKLYFQAQFLNPDGTVSKKELPGPPDYSTWWSCFKPYRTALIMLDIADTEHLDNYAELIRDLDSQLNQEYWFLIAMADYRMRSEHFERIRRRMELQHAELSAAHQGVAKAITAYDPTRPWNEVFRLAVDESAFWQREVKDKAMKFISGRAAGSSDQFRNDNRPTRQPPPPPPPAGKGGNGGRGNKRKRPSGATGNRANACKAFNSEAGCKAADCQYPHVCSFCGMKNHGYDACRNRHKDRRTQSKGSKKVLFSGPSNDTGGIDSYLHDLGYKATMVDIVNSDVIPNDLSSDHTWEHILDNIKSYSFILMEPVCSSFSPARRHSLSKIDHGPRPLRSRDEPWGLSKPCPPFTPKELEQIKLGNLYGRRSALLARAALAAGIPSAIESPSIIYDDQASMFLLPEAVELLGKGAFDVHLDQCMYGALSTKPTCLRVLLPEGSASAVTAWQQLALKCNHSAPAVPSVPSCGKRQRTMHEHGAVHSPLLGKVDDKSFKSKAAQVYPSNLNLALAKAIDSSIKAASTRLQSKALRPPVGQPRAQTALVQMEVTLQPVGRATLTQRAKQAAENDRAIGGLRSPAASIAGLPASIVNGAKINKILDEILVEWKLPLITDASHVRADLISQKMVDQALTRLQSVITLPTDWSQSISPVRGDVLYAIATYLQDPDAEIARWFIDQSGTPMGIEHTMPRTGIFPPVPDDRLPPTDLQRYHDGWANYTSAESEPQVVADLIAEMEKHGWVKQFDSLHELGKAVGDSSPTFSKLGLISKQRPDGSWKHRLIWDLLRSLVNKSTTQSERIILPRLIDLVNDILDLSIELSADQAVWVFIIDIQNAFHLLPLLASEQKYFCTSTGGRFQQYLVMLFGPKAAPTAWGRFGALISRLTQAILGTRDVRLQLYVDDPAAAIKGTTSQRSNHIYKILLLWATLNLPLAWNKAQYGPSVDWIGANIVTAPSSVTTSITKDKLDKAARALEDIMVQSIASKRSLASLAGLLAHLAGIIPQLWPFIRPLWAVLYDTSPSSLKQGQFHTSRIQTTAIWFKAFLEDPKRLLAREYSLRTPSLASAQWLRVSVDASPWGMGGVKWDNNWLPTEYFHAPITDLDQDILDIKIGQSAHMPVLEALAILIAIRQWSSGHEVAFSVRSDAQGAIQALTNLRSPNDGVNRIAGELALDIVDKQFTPLRITHIPGISNVLPDYLSRLAQPDCEKTPPLELTRATQITVQTRDHKWWRTLAIKSIS